ncbi:arginine deiminase-related protein [bacterium]|nr:arginine deiminase-related protein [bacterium]
MKQITKNILMIEPVSFNYNAETALNNYFQKSDANFSKSQIQKKALEEFNNFVKLLRSKQVNVHVIKDTIHPLTPDSIFPNNWISFHSNGEVLLYPMFANNRRLERRTDIIEQLQNEYFVSEVKSLVHYEDKSIFLEGTGSMILDRTNKICYASISLRTNKSIVLDFCDQLNYKPVLFNSFQDVEGKRLPIYHTNVMMCVASDFAIVCLDAIDSQIEKNSVINSLITTNKEIIQISELQANKFAGNMLQVQGDQKYLIMSESAFNTLSEKQIQKIESYCSILYSDLKTIEKFGGGSARCMMAEIFLPLKK